VVAGGENLRGLPQWGELRRLITPRYVVRAGWTAFLEAQRHLDRGHGRWQSPAAGRKQAWSRTHSFARPLADLEFLRFWKHQPQLSYCSQPVSVGPARSHPGFDEAAPAARLTLAPQ